MSKNKQTESRSGILRVSLFQMDSRIGDIEANLKKAESAIRESAEQGSDLFMLPEYWATGYHLDSIENTAAPLDGGFFQQIREYARVNRIAVLCTGARREGSSIRNTSVYYDDQGNPAGLYDKIHLFSLMNETAVFTPGDRPVTLQTRWGCLGFLICYDLRFPELARTLTARGAGIFLIPAYWPAPRLDHWRLLLRARAVENQAVVIGCNRSQINGKLEFGFSAVIAPDGEILAEAGTDETLLHVDIDPAGIRTWRDRFPALKDRR